MSKGNRGGNPNWVKGVSGNPGGRSKAVVGIQELARQHCSTAIEHLAKLVKSATSESAQVQACTALLDRGYGKPPQFNSNDAAQFKRAIDMTDDELAVIAAAGRLGADQTPDDPGKLN